MKTTHIARPRRFRRGFTLIELMVTVTIIVILSSLVVGGYSYIQARQAKEQAGIQIKLLEKAIEEYRLDHGVYPPNFKADGKDGTTNLFNALYGGVIFNASGTQQETKPVDRRTVYLAELDPDNNKQGWIEERTDGIRIVDPWGNEYRYRSNNKSTRPATIYAANADFDLWSCGPDGKSQASEGGDYDMQAAENADDIRGW